MIDNELSKKFESITGHKFTTFYKKYKPKLVWYLTKYTKDQDIAEDFADDAFAQSLLKIENYNRDKSQVHTWIYKIAENLVKKDFKDKKKMSLVSLTKENDDNLNLINVIPNGQMEEINIMEHDKILIKKAELVKEAILKLPEKYKKVMILRELENRPYIDIAEICVKKTDFTLENETKKLVDANDFLYLNVKNESKTPSFVNITFAKNDETVQFVVNQNDQFEIKKEETFEVSEIEIISTGKTNIKYDTTTNLSTIKSQISKGRQLIQSMVSKKFKILEEQGLH